MVPVLLRFVTTQLLLFSLFPNIDAAISCQSDDYCQERLGYRQSYCTKEGTCSNPFTKGCLAVLLLRNSINETTTTNTKARTTTSSTRICNSDDDNMNNDDHIKDDHCIPSSMDIFKYPEIRIHNGNWESSIFISWVMQIILMEVLKVPATVGLTTNTTAASSFYSLQNTLEYSAEAYPFYALKDAVDCQTRNEPCVQVLPEVWNGQAHEISRALKERIIQPVEGNGEVGKGSWYVPKFAAQQDSTLVSVYGLQGEVNRHKLATTFRRPMTWLEYCEAASPTKCDKDDSVAAFYPSTTEQEAHYFHPQFYKGYFHLLPQNNCTLYPNNCTGYIVGPPCTWSTNVDAQLYWNEIVLKPDGPVAPNGGYEYKSMVEIWRAANVTQFPVIFWWWKPEALVEEFFNTSASFQQILLPDATEACNRNRVDTEARCSDDIWVRRGDPQGACDQEFHALLKVVSNDFQQQAQSEPLNVKSPGYDFVKDVKLTDLEVNEMLRRWVNKDVDRFGNDAREAVCSWVVENYDHLLEFIPKGYPKKIDRKNSYQDGYMIAALICAVITCLTVLVVAGASYKYRHRRVFVYAQAHFMFVIVAGFFLIAIGAMLFTLEPSSAVCMAQIWVVNLGYSVHLVPLLVKIAAINKIMSSKNLKRVKINRWSMFKTMGGLLFLVIIYLIIWSTLDPPEVVLERSVANATSSVVEECVICSSENSFWYYVALGWQGFLLVMASVLAFQSRDTIPEFDESRSLGTMIYSHSLFMALRCIVIYFQGSGVLSSGVSVAVLSFLLSFDTLTAMSIYVVPKVFEARSSREDSSVHTRRRQSVEGVQSSFGVSNIEAMSSRAMFCSQSDDAPPRIVQRLGRVPSQLEDTSNLQFTFSPLHVSSNSSNSSMLPHRNSTRGSFNIAQEHPLCGTDGVSNKPQILSQEESGESNYNKIGKSNKEKAVSVAIAITGCEEDQSLSHGDSENNDSDVGLPTFKINEVGVEHYLADTSNEKDT